MSKHLIEQNFCDLGPVEFTLVDLDEKTEEAIDDGEMEFEEAIDGPAGLHNMANWSEIQITKENAKAFRQATEIIESALKDNIPVEKKKSSFEFLIKFKLKRFDCIFRVMKT